MATSKIEWTEATWNPVTSNISFNFKFWEESIRKRLVGFLNREFKMASLKISMATTWLLNDAMNIIMAD